MSRVLVKFFATVREAAGMKNIEMEAEDIRGLIQKLSQKLGQKFRETVLDDEGDKLKRFYSCMINGKRIETLDGYDTRLEDGDAVALFPPIGGG